jgi:hypothetical protein
MTVREMVGAMLASKGVTEPTAKQYRDLQAGLRASLEGHSGEDGGAGWGSAAHAAEDRQLMLANRCKSA